jgi:CMP-N-acetylneuraminic acid synthetase
MQCGTRPGDEAKDYTDSGRARDARKRICFKLNNVLALVTARGGSKGIPGKNIKPLQGKPLLAWSVETAKQSASIARVVISTDDPEIAEVGRQWGAEAPFVRPQEFAADASSHIDVLVHAIEWFASNEGYRPEYVLTLQPTSPLRTAADIDAACAIAEANDADAVIGVEETHHHPYLVRKVGADGRLDQFISTDIEYLRRQDIPAAFMINGAIFLNRRESLLRDGTFEPASAYPYVMPPDRSLQIDTPWDWFLVEKVMDTHRGE